MKKTPIPKPNMTKVYLLICALLIAATVIVYCHGLFGEFLAYDDEQYITLNPIVQHGITADGLKWAFALNCYAANWHPLTWMSHMLDCQLYGLRPFGHHLTNLLLHIASTLLLFFVLARMTGSVWKSAFVAALFAVHPFHVESVAWVAERKDVLSGLFWMLTMGAYVLYSERPGVLRYVAVAVMFALGLMAKPMLVSLPLVLLLLDWWPLERNRARSWGALVLEKLPLFALAVASSIVTFIAQQVGGAMGESERLPLVLRLANAVLSYSIYILKTIWPASLANPYPHPGASISVPLAALSALLLAAIATAVIYLRGSRSYALMGWLWFVVTLVPVIGIVQVGEQAYADRYTYLPLIGLFIVAAWGVPDLVSSFRKPKQGAKGRASIGSGPSKGPAVAGLACVIAFMAPACIQVRYWHDSISLFEHALKVTENNSVAHNNLAKGYEKLNDYQKAADHYAEVVRLRESWAEGHNNYAFALGKIGRTDESFAEYRKAIEIKDAELSATALDPNEAKILMNYGMALIAHRMPTEAAIQFAAAVKRDPTNVEAHYNLACSLEQQGKLGEALAQYQEAIRFQPSEPKAHNNLGVLLYKKGDYPGAWEQVHLCRHYGGVPIPPFVEALRKKMPEPPEQ